MTRRVTLFAVVLMTAALLFVDLSTSATPNPFHAPPLLALGSGIDPGSAHCSALPPLQ